MLTLYPSPPPPFRADAARDELLRLWEGLDLRGQKILIAHARGVAEVTGRVPVPLEPGADADPQS